MHDSGLPMVLTYSTIRDFDNRLRNIESDLHELLTKDDAEVVALRAEVAALVAAGKVSADEKAAMDERVKAALARSETTEARLRSAVPSTTP